MEMMNGLIKKKKKDSKLFNTTCLGVMLEGPDTIAFSIFFRDFLICNQMRVL